MDPRQQIARFGGSVLTSQKMDETRRHARLGRLRLLAACDRDAVTRYVINDELRTPILRNAHGDSGGVLGAAFLADGTFAERRGDPV